MSHPIPNKTEVDIEAVSAEFLSELAALKAWARYAGRGRLEALAWLMLIELQRRDGPHSKAATAVTPLPRLVLDEPDENGSGGEI